MSPVMVPARGAASGMSGWMVVVHCFDADTTVMEMRAMAVPVIPPRVPRIADSVRT